MKELGLGQPEIAWHTMRDRIAEVGCFLGLVTGTLRQDRLRREADDADRGRGGLRAVPRRPRLVEHDAAEAQSDLLGLHHRDAPRWCASTSRRCSTPWSRTTSARPARGRSSGSRCRRFSASPPARWRRRGSWCAGLQVDAKKMRANLDITRGLIVSEAVMMGLGPHIGRQYAHDLVYDICRAGGRDRPAAARSARREHARYGAPRPRRARKAVRPGQLSRPGRRDGRSRAGDAAQASLSAGHPQSWRKSIYRTLPAIVRGERQPEITLLARRNNPDYPPEIKEQLFGSIESSPSTRHHTREKASWTICRMTYRDHHRVPGEDEPVTGRCR